MVEVEKLFIEVKVKFGVVVFLSGVIYEIFKFGIGVYLKFMDIVKVYYIGMLVNGMVFDILLEFC